MSIRIDIIGNNTTMPIEDRSGYCSFHKCFLKKEEIKVKECRTKNRGRRRKIKGIKSQLVITPCKYFEPYIAGNYYALQTDQGEIKITQGVHSKLRLKDTTTKCDCCGKLENTGNMYKWLDHVLCQDCYQIISGRKRGRKYG